MIVFDRFTPLFEPFPLLVDFYQALILQNHPPVFLYFVYFFKLLPLLVYCHQDLIT